MPRCIDAVTHVTALSEYGQIFPYSNIAVLKIGMFISNSERLDLEGFIKGVLCVFQPNSIIYTAPKVVIKILYISNMT